MEDSVGRALRKIYEEAVSERPEQRNSGVASAALKFIKAYEHELSEARLSHISHSTQLEGKRLRAGTRLAK